jgi:hypothetical protein
MQKKGVALGRMRRPSLVHDIECAQFSDKQTQPNLTEDGARKEIYFAVAGAALVLPGSVS